jgi:hypothetical protein
LAHLAFLSIVAAPRRAVQALDALLALLLNPARDERAGIEERRR